MRGLSPRNNAGTVPGLLRGVGGDPPNPVAYAHRQRCAALRAKAEQPTRSVVRYAVHGLPVVLKKPGDSPRVSSKVVATAMLILVSFETRA